MFNCHLTSLKFVMAMKTRLDNNVNKNKNYFNKWKKNKLTKTNKIMNLYKKRDLKMVMMILLMKRLMHRKRKQRRTNKRSKLQSSVPKMPKKIQLVSKLKYKNNYKIFLRTCND